MFGRMYGYRLKRLVNDRTELFWLAIFPIILGFFFHVTFSSITEKAESLNRIPVAVMLEEEGDREIALQAFLEEMNAEDGMLEIVEPANAEEAEELLRKGEVTGILTMEDTVSLKFAKEGMNQTLLKYLVNRYLQGEAILLEAAKKGPEAMQAAAKALYETAMKNEELSIAPGDMDPYASYFFALMAMTCMFGATLGLTNTREIQVNQSMVAVRRGVAPTRKGLMVLTDFLAAFTVEYAVFLLLYVFLTLILGIHFGSQYAEILLGGAVACLNGIAFGYMIGVVVKAKHSVKSAIITSTTLSLCFFAGLMVADMKYTMEKNMPWFNRINPAALISDCFSSLGVFDDLSKYAQCVTILLAEAVIFGAVAALVLRKQKV
ncbi:MAG: ABC transporter permease [Lachnospiraceae bacterium]|nr:ABC transporter permease [Lachnospiraceae bacterium]